MPKRRIPIRIGSPRRSKFGVRTDKIGKLARTVDGILFASQREANRYCELKVMPQAVEWLCNQIIKSQLAIPREEEGQEVK